MDPKDLLTAMADLFAQHPERWTHGAFARNEVNMAVDHLAPDAFSFNCLGFLDRAFREGLVDELQSGIAHDLFVGACAQLYHDRDLTKMNDHQGREAVIACARLAGRVSEAAFAG